VPATFQALAALVGQQMEPMLHALLLNNVHLVHYEPGRLEFRPDRHAPANLAGRLQKLLSDWTGKRWVVSVSNDEGAPTLNQQQRTSADRLRVDSETHPLVKAVQEVFPQASIVAVRERAPPSLAVPPDLAIEPHPDPEDSDSEGEPD